MRQLSVQDSSFIYQEQPHAPLHGSGVYIYDQSTAPGGRVTFKGILEDVERRLHLVPILRERLLRVPMDLDHPYWVRDAEFDLEFHVRHLALPAPGDWRQLCIQLARLHARPLDLDRPPWEMYVIEGLDAVAGTPPGSYAMMLKTHHAAIDGVSGMQLITALHDVDPRAEPPPAPAEPWEPDPIPPHWELMARAGANNVARMARMVDPSRWFAPPPTPSAPPPTMAPAPPVPPRTRFNGTVSSHRVFDAIEVPFEGLRQTRSAVPGATVNDAVLAVVGGALRRYLHDTGELPADPLVAMIPVSVRTADDPQFGNQVAAIVAGLGTHIADPVERLGAIRDATSIAKERFDAVGARQLVELAELVPGTMIGQASRLSSEMGLANQLNPPYNVVVTNVPGPEHALDSSGARLVRQLGIGMVHDGMGLMHSAQTYLGEMIISFVACRTMLPDPAVYAECLQASHDELVRAVGASTRAAKPRPAKRTASRPARPAGTTPRAKRSPGAAGS
jgi:WS/DGAT/MGAT family acyltransferase